MKRVICSILFLFISSISYSQSSFILKLSPEFIIPFSHNELYINPILGMGAQAELQYSVNTTWALFAVYSKDYLIPDKKTFTDGVLIIDYSNAVQDKILAGLRYTFGNLNKNLRFFVDAGVGLYLYSYGDENHQYNIPGSDFILSYSQITQVGVNFDFGFCYNLSKKLVLIPEFGYTSAFKRSDVTIKETYNETYNLTHSEDHFILADVPSRSFLQFSLGIGYNL